MKCDPEDRLVSDFDWLVVNTTWIVDSSRSHPGSCEEKPHCWLPCSNHCGEAAGIEDKTPIHIADVHIMTEEFLQRLRKKHSNHDGGTGGDSLTAGMGVTPQKVSLEKGMSLISTESVGRGWCRGWD